MNGTALVPKLPGSLKVTGNSASDTPMTTTIPTLNALEKRLYIRRTGNGRVRAASSDPTIADVRIVDDDYLVVTGRKKGLTQITVSMEEGTRHRAPQDFTFDVNCHSLPTGILSQDTWAQMKEAAQNGVADRFWGVGDLSPFVQLNGKIADTAFNLKLNYRIVDLRPDKITFLQACNEQGKQIALVGNRYVIHIESNQDGICMNRRYRIGTGAANSTQANGPNDTGYNGSYGDIVVVGNYYEALPSAVKSAITDLPLACINKGGTDGTPEAISYVKRGVFIPSQVEMCGSVTGINRHLAAHLTQWEWFRRGNSRIYYKHNSPSQATDALLRDADGDHDDAYRTLGTNGAPAYTWAAVARGLICAFFVAA